MESILAPVLSFFTWIARAIRGIFVDLWEIIKDAFSWIFDQVLSLAVTIVGSINLSSIPTLQASFSGIPPVAVEVLSAIGITQALSIIVTSLGIRLILQLIPFTRLGS